MQRAKKKFLGLMAVELADLQAHIEALVYEILDRYEREEITEHVCLGNLAVLRKEKHALRHFEGILARMQTEDYADMQEMVCGLKSIFREETKRFDLSEAACRFAEYKMRRIEDYISDTHWSDEKQAYLTSMEVS